VIDGKVPDLVFSGSAFEAAQGEEINHCFALRASVTCHAGLDPASSLD